MCGMMLRIGDLRTRTSTTGCPNWSGRLMKWRTFWTCGITPFSIFTGKRFRKKKLELFTKHEVPSAYESSLGVAASYKDALHFKLLQ
ncbi:hypothetical protein ACS0TY_005458 [Phlomoides rotata]